MTEPRTVGGSLLRQALDDVREQVKADSVSNVVAYAAYDRESGVQLGMAYLWHGPKGSEWTVTGALSRKVQAAQSPYAVRLELRGKL